MVLRWLLDGERNQTPLLWHHRTTVQARYFGAAVEFLGENRLSGGEDSCLIVITDDERDLSGYKSIGDIQSDGGRVLHDLDGAFTGEKLRRYHLLRALEFHDASSFIVRAWTREIERFERKCLSAIRRADAVTCNNAHTAAVASEVNPNVFVCESAIDPDDWPAPTPRRDDVFRVGFAGTSSHIDDLWLVRDALVWASQQPGVEVVLVGWDPAKFSPTQVLDHCFEKMQAARREPAPGRERALLEDALARARAHIADWAFPYTVLPFTTDWSTYVANLGSLDVGLAPTDLDSTVSPFRGTLKPLEYAMVGALPIPSGDHVAYDDWHGRVPTPTTPEEFLEAVQRAVTNRDEVRERAAAARDYVLAEKTISAIAWQWENAIDSEVLCTAR